MKHNEYSKLKIPKCPVCGKEMYLEDIDYNYDGNQENYFGCNNDNVSCFQQVRHGKIIFEEVKENE